MEEQVPLVVCNMVSGGMSLKEAKAQYYGTEEVEDVEEPEAEEPEASEEVEDVE